MNILLFKLRYLGDVLLTTPAVRLLRRSFPNADITMVVNEGTEDLLRHDPHLNRVLTVQRERGWRATWRLVRALRERRYEVSIDFASSDRAAWLALLAGAPRRIGVASTKGFRQFIHTHKLPLEAGIHTVDLNLALARFALGVETSDAAPELHTGAEDETFARELLAQHGLDESNFILAHLGGRYPENLWPLENWRALVKSAPLPVVFVGTAQDAERTAHAGGLSLAGRTTVLQVAALARRAVAFVGHDSGPMHIAAAMGTRVVALFGPTNRPAAWRPWGEGHTVLRTTSDVGEVVSALSRARASGFTT